MLDQSINNTPLRFLLTKIYFLSKVKPWWKDNVLMNNFNRQDFQLNYFYRQLALGVVNSTKSKEILSIADNCSWRTGKWSWELEPIRANQGQGLKINCDFSMDSILQLMLCFFPSIVVSRQHPPLQQQHNSSWHDIIMGPQCFSVY